MRHGVSWAIALLNIAGLVLLGLQAGSFNTLLRAQQSEPCVAASHSLEKPATAPSVRLSSGQLMPLVGMGTGFDDCSDGEDECTKDMLLTPGSAAALAHGAVLYYGALRAGVRLFDTAPTYGSEAPVGEAMMRAQEEGWLRREEVFLVAKVPNPDNSVWPKPASPLPSGFVAAELKRTLAKLRTGYVDVLMIHHGDALEELGLLGAVWQQMEGLVDAGLVRSLGLRAEPLGNRCHPAAGAGGGRCCELGGLCPSCEIFTRMRIKPALVFAEELPAMWPFDSATTQLWREHGIVIMGAGASSKNWVTRSVTGHEEVPLAARREFKDLAAKNGMSDYQARLRWKAECGSALGKGPVVFQTAKLAHIKDNLRAFQAPYRCDEAQRDRILAAYQIKGRTEQQCLAWLKRAKWEEAKQEAAEQAAAEQAAAEQAAAEQAAAEQATGR